MAKTIPINIITGAVVEPHSRRYRQLEESLTNHTPDKETIRDIEKLRAAAKMLGARIIEDVPEGREQAIALTRIEEATMWAVKGMVLPGEYD